MDLRLISTPLTQADKLGVVTLDEVKAQARILDTDEDELIKSYIEAAYDFLAGPEGWLGGCDLLVQQYEFYPGPLVDPYFEIPMRPLQADGFTFESMSGGSYVAVDNAGYYLQGSGLFWNVTRPTGKVWPTAAVGENFPFRVRFSAGYGTTKEAVPSPIRLAIKMLAAYWVSQRETVGSEGRTVGKEIEYGLQRLCGRYRVLNDHS